ncbi:MAG: helix-turn-helix transcriptional regulator [Actinomycetota bacterium]|nr:helix-turn-helix transcriptional regulator [Actinomycetota bacterium]
MSEFGLTKADTSSLYRTLRALEDEGLVESWWAPAVAGPARRMYRATAAGARTLEDTTAAVAVSHENLSAYLRRHRALAIPAPHQQAAQDQRVVAVS